MALVDLGPNNVPNYTALSSDISSSKITGASRVSNIVLTTNDLKWYIILADLTLADYGLPVVLNGDITVGVVDQGDAGVENWLVDVRGAATGIVTETAPATDTASSGLNGRLQRIAQRLTSLIALLPTALGANGGLKIEGVASGTTVPVSGTITATTGGLTDTQLRATAVPVSNTQLPSALGQAASAASLAVVLPSDQTVSVSSTPGVTSVPSITISATPDYAVGDVIGGIITLTSIPSASGGKAKLVSANVVDKAGQSPQFSMYFFKATPSGGTYTDNAAIVWGSGDGANAIGTVSFVSADYNTVGGISFSTMGEINQMHVATATSIFVLIIADATYNAASTSDLIVTFGYERE